MRATQRDMGGYVIISSAEKQSASKNSIFMEFLTKIFSGAQPSFPIFLISGLIRVQKISKTS